MGKPYLGGDGIAKCGAASRGHADFQLGLGRQKVNKQQTVDCIRTKPMQSGSNRSNSTTQQTAYVAGLHAG